MKKRKEKNKYNILNGMKNRKNNGDKNKIYNNEKKKHRYYKRNMM